MVRKLVKTLLSLSLVAPAAALALGVGEVQLHSALNQRLDADIELLSVDPAEADTIDASLASSEDFAKVGLDRPANLMFLRFNVEQKPGGGYYIKLTSREPIREPFLDFLVEVKWRSGRVLREYTLLLDPPVSYRESTPAIAAPSTGQVAATATKPSVPEEEFVPPPSSIPVAPGVTTPETFPSRMPEPVAAPAGGIVYGPVKADETLWGIARKLRPSSDISVQQMMVALLIANPYAFFDNNINRLKKGFVLRIDDPAVITAMNKAEAAREVSRQTRQWQDYRAAAAAKAAKRPVSAATKAPGAAVAAAKTEPKLELVAPEGKAEKPGAAAGATAESMQQDLMLALESSAAQRKENEELQKRVQGLEEQLKDMQRLLSLKDADLATLQQQLRKQGAAVSLPSEKAEAPAVAAPTEAKPAQPEMAPAPAEKPAAEAKPQPQAQPVPKPEAKPAPKKPVVKKPAPAPEPSIVDMILGDPMMMAAGGGALLLILILVLVMIRRRRGGGFQESILSGRVSSMMNENAEPGAETSFLSDLAVSGMGGGAIHTDEGEVDPLTEADVFMAYGRHQQAEEVLNKALEKNPERLELTAKLLEVYYNLRDADKFLAQAEERADELKSNEGLWGHVAAMGHELMPEQALFEVAAGAEAPTAKAPVAKAEPISEDVLDIGLDLDELTAEMESEGAGGDLGLDLGLDFGSLEEEAEPAAEAAAQGAAAAEEETGGAFEFDLDLGGEEEHEEQTVSGFELELGGEAEQEPALEETGFELDLGALEEEEPAPAGEEETLDFGLELGAEAPAEEEETGLDLGGLEDFDFGDLGLETTEEETVSAEPAEEGLGLDMAELGLGETEQLASFDDLGDLEEEGLLSDSEEITTKLDLAQAYIEMGDNDGARSMLEEVAEAGNDDQKQQAQELLAKI